MNNDFTWGGFLLSLVLVGGLIAAACGAVRSLDRMSRKKMNFSFVGGMLLIAVGFTVLCLIAWAAGFIPESASPKF